MSPEDQKAFVYELSNNIAKVIASQIDAGRVPERWDGIELRLLLAGYHQKSAAMSRHDKKRIREFNTTVLVNGL